MPEFLIIIDVVNVPSYHLLNLYKATAGAVLVLSCLMILPDCRIVIGCPSKLDFSYFQLEEVLVVAD